MDVLVTGAYGRCGTALIDHLVDGSGYRFSCFDRSDPPSHPPYDTLETIVGDVTEFESLSSATAGRDAMIHLAGYPYTDGSWEDVSDPNILGMYNALEAARVHELDTFVFASTNHVVGMFEQSLAPRIYYPDHGVALDHTAPIRPDSYYGSTKAFGEALCRQYAEGFEYPRHVYALRICSVRHEQSDHPYGDAEEAVGNGEIERDSEEYRRRVARMKAMWHSRRDFAHEIECCLADDDVDFGIFSGVSDNSRRWFSIEHARAVLGYRPRDDAEAWDGPPP